MISPATRLELPRDVDAVILLVALATGELPPRLAEMTDAGLLGMLADIPVTEAAELRDPLALLQTVRVAGRVVRKARFFDYARLLESLTGWDEARCTEAVRAATEAGVITPANPRAAS